MIVAVIDSAQVGAPLSSRGWGAGLGKWASAGGPRPLLSSYERVRPWGWEGWPNPREARRGTLGLQSLWGSPFSTVFGRFRSMATAKDWCVLSASLPLDSG